MRQLRLQGRLLATSAAIMLAACGSAAVDQPGPAPVDPRLYQDAGARVVAHVKTTEEIFRAERDTAATVLNGYVQDDFKASSALLDPDGNLSFPGLSEANDRKGAIEVLGHLFDAFSGRKFAIGRVWQPAHVAVVEWTMAGVHSAPWMGVMPTQRPVTIRGLSIYSFDPNGLVNDSHLFFDVGATLAELGAGPKGVEAPQSTAPLASDVALATGADAEKQNLALVNASWDAFETKNEAGYLAPLADDIEVFRLDRAAPERGKTERKKFFKWATGGIGSLSQTPLNSWGVGPFVIEEYSITGVHSGKLFDGQAPSGHALRIHCVDIDEVKDGKVVRTWTYANSLELYAETGLVPHAAPGSQ